MKGAKTASVHDWQVFEIWVKSMARSECPNKNCTTIEYQQVTLHRNGPSRLPHAGRVYVAYLAK